MIFVELTDIFSNYGFPVAMVVVMCLYIWKTQQQHREEMKAMQDRQSEELKDIRAEHKAEVKELSRAVDRLSDLVTQFIMVAKGESDVPDKVGVSKKG